MEDAAHHQHRRDHGAIQRDQLAHLGRVALEGVGAEQATSVSDLERRIEVAVRLGKYDVAAPGDRVHVVHVAAHKPLEQVERPLIAELVEDTPDLARGRSACGSRWLTPESRGLSTQGAGTRSRNSRTRSLLMTATKSGTRIPRSRPSMRIASLSRKNGRPSPPCPARASARAAPRPSRGRTRPAEQCGPRTRSEQSSSRRGSNRRAGRGPACRRPRRCCRAASHHRAASRP